MSQDLTGDAKIYLAAVRVAITEDDALRKAVSKWVTRICPECGEVPGRHQPDGAVPADDGFVHYTVAGAVAIGCEGYWVINPNVLGLGHDRWHDWTEVRDAVPTGEKVNPADITPF